MTKVRRQKEQPGERRDCADARCRSRSATSVCSCVGRFHMSHITHRQLQWLCTFRMRIGIDVSRECACGCTIGRGAGSRSRGMGPTGFPPRRSPGPGRNFGSGLQLSYRCTYPSGRTVHETLPAPGGKKAGVKRCMSEAPASCTRPLTMTISMSWLVSAASVAAGLRPVSRTTNRSAVAPAVSAPSPRRSRKDLSRTGGHHAV